MSKNPIDSRELKAFNKALAEYAHYNTRELGPVIENRANRMRWELYRQFRDQSPTKEELSAELEARDYQFYRRFDNDGQRLSAGQELVARRKSLKYLSLGYLMRDWRWSREGQNVSYYQHDRLSHLVGKTIVKTRETRNPSVELINMLSAARHLNVQRNLVARALAKQTADIKKYIVRKQQQEQRRMVARAQQYAKVLAA